MKKTGYLAGSALLALLSLLTSVAAQAEVGNPDSAIETVTVTAQKREQDAQSVPISITAFSGRKLEELGVDRALDLTSQVPNLGVFTIFGDAQQPSFNIRGIGLLSYSDSFEPPVAMYVDEVYVGSGVGQSMQLFDIERVEVLRGPQGTLFGRNTTGGLFQIISNRPADELMFDGSFQYGSYNQTIVSAAISGPVVDGVRLRLAGRYDRDRGWAKGFFDGKDYNNTNSYALRGEAEFDVGSKGDLLLIASTSRADELMSGFGVTGYLDPVTGLRCSIDRIRAGDCVSPSLGGVSGNDLGGFRPGHTYGETAATFGLQPRQSVRANNVSAHFTYDFDGWTLTVLPAYQQVKKYYFENLVAFSDGFTMDQRQFTQEIRANGELNWVNWVAGIFYYNDSKELGSFDPTPIFGFTSDAQQNTNSWAGYGQAEISLSDTVKATAGTRYTAEKRKIHYSTDFGLDVNQRTSASLWTGKLGLSWQVQAETLLFASISNGFKSGGFNGQFIFSADALDPVRREKVTDFEGGIKTDFWDGRARINTTAFYYNYQDVQLGIVVEIPSGGVATRLRNAGDAQIYGLESELYLKPTDSLDVTLGIGLIDATLQDHNLLSSAGTTVDTKGHHLPMTPPVKLNFDVRYTLPFEDNTRGWIQADGQWLARHYFTVANVDTGSSDAYGVFNVRAGYQFDGGHWELEGFVENVFDRKYVLLMADQTPDFGAVTWGRPRWAGVSIRAKY